MVESQVAGSAGPEKAAAAADVAPGRMREDEN